MNQRQTKQLTEELIAELSGQTAEQTKASLTSLHQKGYNVEPFVRDMIACPDGVHCSPEDRGFNSTSWGKEKLWIYTLDDNEAALKKTSFIYQDLEDGTYRKWPG